MYQNQGLPVRVDQLDPQATQFDFRGLPFNPPFTLNVQVATPALQQQIPFITGATLAEVLNNAQKNQIRVFHANMVSSNGWQTREFAEMVQNTAFIAEYLMLTKNMHPQQAITDAAHQAAIVSMGILASQYQQQLSPLIVNPQIADALNQAVAVGHQWANELKNFHLQMSRNIGSGGGAPMNPQFGGNPIYGGGNPQYGGNVGYTGRPAPGYTGNRGQGGGGYGGVHPATVGGRGPSGPGMFQYGQQGNQSNTGNGGSVTRSGMKPAVRRNNPTNEMLSMDAAGQRTHERWDSGDAQTRVEANAGKMGTSGPFQFKGPGEQIDRMPETPAPTPRPSGPISLSSRAAIVAKGNLQQAQQQKDQYPRALDPTHPEYGFELEDGTQVKPAEYSDWTLTLDPDTQPYRPVYNTETHQLLHIRRPDGTVLARLEPRNEDMNYKDHEMNPELRRQAREREEANGPKIATPKWNQVKDIKPVRGSFGGLAAKAAAKDNQNADEAAPVDTSNDLATPAPKPLENVVTVHNLKEAQLKLSMFLKGKEVEPGTPVEFLFDVVDTIMTKEDLTIALNQMETATTFDELCAQLQELEELVGGKDGDYEEVFTVIDKRLTDSINQALAQNYSLDDWGIDSFSSDYTDLLGALEEKFGAAMVENFLGHSTSMIGSALSVLRGEALSAYQQSLGLEETGEMLAFRDRCSLTQVPWKFEDLHLDLNGGGMVPEAAMPELHAAMSAVLSRTEDFPVTFSHRYLQTADKVLIELRQGFLGSDAILLYPVA